MILLVEVEIAIRFQAKISRNVSDRIVNKSRYLYAPLCTIYISNIKKIGSAEVFSFSSWHYKYDFVISLTILIQIIILTKSAK